jgi:hypothetical protein
VPLVPAIERMPTPPKPSMTEGNVHISTLVHEAAVLHDLAHATCSWFEDQDSCTSEESSDGEEEDCSLPMSHLRSLALAFGLHHLVRFSAAGTVF